MNRIILDELERRWWLWGLLCPLVCLLFGFLSALSKDSVYFALYLIPVTANVLPQKLRFGRVLLSLPLTTRQIGQTFWMIAVAIPSVLLAFFGGLGVLFQHSFTTHAGFLEIWSRIVVIGSLGCGSAFWLFSGAPTNPQEQWHNRIAGQLYSYGFSIALIGGGYLLYKSDISNEMKFVIVCLLGLVFSVLGWFRAEGLIVDYAADRKEITNLFRSKAIFRPRTGYGGIPYLIVNSFIRFLGILIVAIVVAVGIPLWKDHRFVWPHILDSMQMIRFFLFLFCLWPVLPVGVHQKFLRSLPMTSKELSAVILCLPTLPFLILCAIFIPIDFQRIGAPAALSLLKTELLFLAPLYVFVTAIVWRDESKPEKIARVVIVLMLSAIPATIQLMYVIWNPGKQDLPVWVVVIVPLASCSLALLKIRNLLEKNDMTYRIQVQPLTDVNSPNW